MFSLVPSPSFEATVHISTAGGGHVPLRLTFRHKSKSQLGEWVAGAAGRTDAEFTADVVSGWADVVDGAGLQVEFSQAALAQMLDQYPSAAEDIYRGYRKALTESREKN